jgi:hypothetical protein
VKTSNLTGTELFQVVDAERDIEQARSGGSLVYQTITGLQPQDSVEDESESSSSSEEGSNFVNSSRPRDESPESKKVSLSSLASCIEDMNPGFRKSPCDKARNWDKLEVNTFYE